MEHAPLKVLIVEDEMILAMNTKLSLEDAGYTVTGIAITGEDALSLLESVRPDVVLMDITLGGELDGIETAAEIRDRYAVPFIYMTGSADERTIEKAKKTNPLGFLQKPVKEYELYDLLQKGSANRGLS